MQNKFFKSTKLHGTDAIDRDQNVVSPKYLGEDIFAVWASNFTSNRSFLNARHHPTARLLYENAATVGLEAPELSQYVLAIIRFTRNVFDGLDIDIRRIYEVIYRALLQHGRSRFSEDEAFLRPGAFGAADLHPRIDEAFAYCKDHDWIELRRFERQIPDATMFYDEESPIAAQYIHRRQIPIFETVWSVRLTADGAKTARVVELAETPTILYRIQGKKALLFDGPADDAQQCQVQLKQFLVMKAFFSNTTGLPSQEPPESDAICRELGINPHPHPAKAIDQRFASLSDRIRISLPKEYTGALTLLKGLGSHSRQFQFRLLPRK